MIACSKTLTPPSHISDHTAALVVFSEYIKHLQLRLDAASVTPLSPVGAAPGRAARGGEAQFLCSQGGRGGGVLRASTLSDLEWCPCGTKSW